MVEVRIKPMVMMIVKSKMVFTYHRISVSLKTRLKLPFRNNNYNKEKLMPERNMNDVMTYSMYGELKAAILACLVEKPPVAVVVMA